MASIEELRKSIDKIDNRILTMLKKRVELARKISRIKAKKNLPIRDIVREREVVERAVTWARKDGLNQKLTSDIFKTIIELCVEAEKKQKGRG
ncbi:chorismate mutase [Candidatus Bathyarchaeota archaeon]|nr:chorismate mutase [Candidatus Bathyarchaeota archaeon]MBS7629364.1 chorismate mutase [Candidatus Bathyarchaeota archaeon]